MPGNSGSALHAHRFLFRAALSLVTIFAWILVFQFFVLASDSVSAALIATALMYAVSQIAVLLLTPLSAAHLRRGAKQSLVFATVLAAAAYIYLGATLAGTIAGANPAWGIATFAFLLGAYRALYWVPYRLEAATGGGTHISLPYELILACMPIFAGLTLALEPFAPLRLFYGAATIFTLSLVPLFFVRDVRESYSWSYFSTFRTLFKRRERTLLLATLAPGVWAEGLPDLGEAAQAEFSPAMERRIGESIMLEIRRDPAWLDDPEINSYLNRLGNRLSAQSEQARQEFEFFALRDSTLNAFAMPGGYIGVHSGLILAAASESELASVLAHEISHVTQHHLARLINKSGQGQVTSMLALAVAILAARSSPDLAVGAAMAAGLTAGIF